MKSFRAFTFLISILLFATCGQSLECELNNKDPHKVAYTITVGQSSKIKSIQDAINSIPSNNNKWIRIYIPPGTYREKVAIPCDKPCIVLEGRGAQKTSIEWNDHQATDVSATFTSSPDYIVAKGIAFKNTYNVNENDVVPAVAARIYGDKSAFYNCAFVGLQDTLWDVGGRHYYHNCFITGGIDFIWGAGQSIYENCRIQVNIGKRDPTRLYGAITAQARNSSQDTSGFVFKSCIFDGQGKALLGRAYASYSRVIIARSIITDVVVPEGWDAWDQPINNLEYVEANNNGTGADTSKRVGWMKKLSEKELQYFVDMSYIDREGWLAKLP